MSEDKKQAEKSRLHSRNKNRERYDLAAVINTSPELNTFIKPNKLGDDSVDFSNPEAVKTLNTALLKHYYGIENWKFPDENLCPPIPGRAVLIRDDEYIDEIEKTKLAHIKTRYTKKRKK